MLGSSQLIYELDFKSSLKPVMQGGAPKSEDNLIGNSSLFPTKVRSKTSWEFLNHIIRHEKTTVSRRVFTGNFLYAGSQMRELFSHKTVHSLQCPF